jgi:hypothetical protein
VGAIDVATIVTSPSDGAGLSSARKMVCSPPFSGTVNDEAANCVLAISDGLLSSLQAVRTKKMDNTKENEKCFGRGKDFIGVVRN